MTDAEFLSALTRSVDLRVAGDLRGSIQFAAEAANSRPDEPSAWHTLAMAAADIGEYKIALHCRWRAVELLDVLAIHSTLPNARGQYIQQCVFGYATSLLLDGQWGAAWPLWEAGRLGYSWHPPQGTRYWRGKEDADGDLLVVCEGGYGDLFLFSRFLPMLHASHRGRIGLIVFRGLRNFRDWVRLGVSEVYEIGDSLPLGVWKYSTSIMSLPAMLGVRSLDEIPTDYLVSTSIPRPVNTSGIGFCWRSEENQTKRRFRSLNWKDAEEIAGALAEESAVYSLCPQGRELSGRPVSAHRTPVNLICDDSEMTTWGATARYISRMSMVVTVDTAVAHLAGLLGVPTLLLLPLNVDWKWGMEGDRTPWYPSVRLFRNRLPLEWERERIIEGAVNMYREVARG